MEDKETKEILEKFDDILAEHLAPGKVAATVAAMEPKERLMFLSKLLDYAVPRLKQTDIEADVGSDVITVIPPNFDRAARIKELKQKLFETDE
ncbi:hypothetical protein C8N47_106209 [Mangrovibacterium marinum]|uniref:Uncharacterized protein n=2 Tax=Mangrovibacterium marinum TaxID=1639118 RepID=A0A2T5C318_9BACT|nr:hypothetical protein C8N47_106209 [Mangrovibacterium marinum]